jgi:hypothetical protein
MAIYLKCNSGCNHLDDEKGFNTDTSARDFVLGAETDYSCKARSVVRLFLMIVCSEAVMPSERAPEY